MSSSQSPIDTTTVYLDDCSVDSLSISPSVFTVGPIQTNYEYDFSINHNAGLTVTGDAEFEGDVKIKGRSITELLNQIEQRLAILEPNKELEAEWAELHELGERYRKLEKELAEKSRVWGLLKT